MNRLSPAHIREYIAKRKTEDVTGATINRELEVLSAAINYANRECFRIR